jgi:transposase
MGRHVEIKWQESEEELRQRYRQETNAQRRTRLHALWLLRQGKSISEVSKLVGVHYRTLQRWIAWYREGGIEAVLTRVTGHHATGQPPKLTSLQRSVLRQRVASGAYRSVPEVVRWVEQYWGIRYTYQGMYSLLKRYQAALKRPDAELAHDEVHHQQWKKGIYYGRLPWQE